MGISSVWIVEPKARAVLVYSSATEAKKLEENQILYGEEDLYGFEVPVAAIFQDVALQDPTP